MINKPLEIVMLAIIIKLNKLIFKKVIAGKLSRKHKVKLSDIIVEWCLLIRQIIAKIMTIRIIGIITQINIKIIMFPIIQMDKKSININKISLNITIILLTVIEIIKNN